MAEHLHPSGASMQFRAYKMSAVSCSRIERDEVAGILGRLTPSGPPLGESDSREGIEEIAFACLGRDPTEFVLIADAENRWLDSISCEKYDALADKLELQFKWHFIAWSTVFLCLVCFIAANNGLGRSALGIFFFVALLNAGANTFLNEVESLVVTVIVLILTLLVFSMAH